MTETPESSLVLVNGQPSALLSVHDRGLHYGDGVFRTLLVHAGKARDLEYQLEKMRQDAERLSIAAPQDWLWEQDIRTVVGSTTTSLVLKMMLTRGSSQQRGYRADATQPPTRIALSYALPELPASYWTQGISLYECRTRLGHNPALAGIKHLNRLEQVLARNEFSGEYAEGVMLDIHEHVVCGTMSNLFIVTADRLRTPSLMHCGVSGVMRRRILELADTLAIETGIEDLKMEDCMHADEIFVSNSLIGIWPVKQLRDRKWLRGPMTQKLQNHLAHPLISSTPS